jgi:hypothetical protein
MKGYYFAEPISDNIEETPEGNLICHDCVIGRTGWQTYKVGDLPQEAADQLGVDTSNPGANIDLYRDKDDVFNRDFLASLEGKPVTDNHPPGFVTPDNFSEHARGHMQNVREGVDPLDSGDYPIIADVIVTAEPLLSKIKNKTVRELSLGYDYSIRKEDGRILQTDMRGNHVAVVPKGRAGSEARINDGVPEAAGAAATTTTTTDKEKPIVNANKVKVSIRHLLGLGLKEYAKDADPEDLAEAASQAQVLPADDVRSDDRKADDRKADDRRADDRKRFHDALDRALDRRSHDTGDVADKASDMADDADLNELRGLLDSYFSEEQQEPEHAAADQEEDEPLNEEEPDESEEPVDDLEGQETDPSGKEVVVGDKKAHDRAVAIDGAMTVLRAMRPIVARSKDRGVKQAFNTALDSINKRSRASTSSYGKFARTAVVRAKAADARQPGQDNRIASLQAAYNKAFSEVK